MSLHDTFQYGKQTEFHTSNSSNGLPRRYTSLLLLLSLGRILYSIVLHPTSKTAVLPIVTSIKLYGGKWPDDRDLITIPNCINVQQKQGCNRHLAGLVTPQKKAIYGVIG